MHCYNHLCSLLIHSMDAIGLMSRVFVNGPGDQGLIPGQVIPKTQKLVLDAALLNTRHYKVRIKGKVEQSWEWSSAHCYTSVWYLLKREPVGRPRLRLPTIFMDIVCKFYCWQQNPYLRLIYKFIYKSSVVDLCYLWGCRKE